MTKTIIVTSANEAYFHLAQDLVASLRDKKFANSFDVGFLDTGLSLPQKIWMASQGVTIKQAQRHYDFPICPVLEQQSPGFRTLMSSMFMRDYFPDYDVYLWLDADIWVQTTEGIDCLIESAAKSEAIHIAAEFDRCYTALFESTFTWELYKTWYRENFDDATAEAMAYKPMINVGVFAMAKNSPVWDAWIKIYGASISRMTEANNKSFMANQLGLNILLYQEKLPHVIMPASFNWLTAFTLPAWDYDRKLYVEPTPPYRAISHLHLTRPIKGQIEKIACVQGGITERSLLRRDIPGMKPNEFNMEAPAFMRGLFSS